MYIYNLHIVVKGLKDNLTKKINQRYTIELRKILNLPKIAHIYIYIYTRIYKIESVVSFKLYILEY